MNDKQGIIKISYVALNCLSCLMIPNFLPPSPQNLSPLQPASHYLPAQAHPLCLLSQLYIPYVESHTHIFIQASLCLLQSVATFTQSFLNGFRSFSQSTLATHSQQLLSYHQTHFHYCQITMKPMFRTTLGIVGELSLGRSIQVIQLQYDQSSPSSVRAALLSQSSTTALTAHEELFSFPSSFCLLNDQVVFIHCPSPLRLLPYSFFQSFPCS